MLTQKAVQIGAVVRTMSGNFERIEVPVHRQANSHGHTAPEVDNLRRDFSAATVSRLRFRDFHRPTTITICPARIATIASSMLANERARLAGFSNNLKSSSHEEALRGG